MRRLFSRLFDSGVHVSCSNICVTLSNIPYLPFTKRAALRCTISSLSELYFWRGCQTVALYSRKDLTREKYAVSLSFSGQPFRLRFRKDNLEFALDVMTSMCFVWLIISLKDFCIVIRKWPTFWPSRLISRWQKM